MVILKKISVLLMILLLPLSFINCGKGKDNNTGISGAIFEPLKEPDAALAKYLNAAADIKNADIHANFLIDILKDIPDKEDKNSILNAEKFIISGSVGENAKDSKLSTTLEFQNFQNCQNYKIVHESERDEASTKTLEIEYTIQDYVQSEKKTSYSIRSPREILLRYVFYFSFKTGWEKSKTSEIKTVMLDGNKTEKEFFKYRNVNSKIIINLSKDGDIVESAEEFFGDWSLQTSNRGVDFVTIAQRGIFVKSSIIYQFDYKSTSPFRQMRGDIKIYFK